MDTSPSPFPPIDSSAAPLAQRVVRGGLWVAASSYFNVAFGFLANLALTRILAPDDFGVFALATFFFSLINLRPRLAVGYAFAQQRETTGELVGSYLGLDVSAGAATLLVAAAAVPVLHALGYAWDVVWVVLALAVVGISDSFMGTAWTLLDKELHFGRTSLVSSVVFPLSYVPGLWLALHGGHYWSLVAQGATYSLGLLVGMWWVVRRQLPHVWRMRLRFDRKVAFNLARFGIVVGAASLAGVLVSQFDNFLVGTFVSLETLGFYARAYQIAQWPTVLVTTVISRATFYTYARLQDDPARLRRTVTMSLWLITTLALPLAIGIFVAAPDLVGWLYGELWRPSAVFLRFLVAYSVIRPLLDDASALFVAVGKPHRSVLVTVAESATLIVVGTPLTLVGGAVGTCLAVGVTFIVGLLLTYRYVAQTIRIQLLTTLGLPLLSAVVAVAAYAGVLRLVDLNALPLAVGALAKMAFGAGIYLAVMLALQGREMLDHMKSVYRLLRPDTGVPDAPMG